MEIVVHDNTLKTVAVINNDIPMLPSFFNDNWHRYKDQGAETFIFTVNKFINGQLQDYCRFLNEQAYISFTYDGIDHLFGVENVQESDYQITLTCSSLNLELRNEQANALVNTSSHNIQWYIDQMELISNAQITIGTNEVSSLTRTINYDGQESKLARLISVIGNFDAEFEFITHLNDDGTLDSVILNIYRANDGVNAQGVGTNRNDVSLNFGKNISGITRTGDTTNLFNATKITGSDDLNWNSSEFSYVNSDGVEEFYKRKNDDTAFAPLSLNLFKSQIKSNNGDKWIRKDFQTEYTNVNDMWGYCVSQFKQFAYPTVTYEVLANSSLVLESVGNDWPLSIGDTINIQDDNFMDSDGNVGLLLSARVSEMEISFSNPTLNKITFSNFKKQQSEASADIQAIVNQLVDAATPFRAELSTTNGTQFKNGTGSTTLSAHIFKGSATTETVADSYEWSKDGTVVAPTQTITVDASGVTDKAVYSFKATVAGKVVASQSVTITNVDDGTNGRSVTNVSQKWRLTTTTATPTQAWSDAGWLTTQPTTTATNKYLWSITRTTFNLAPLTQDVIEQKAVYGDKGDKGDTGNDGRAGKDGVGLRSTTVTYTISSSGTVTPTTGWTSQVPTLVKEQHLWTKTLWTYTDNTIETGYSVSYIAKDGNNGTNGIAGKDGVGISNTIIEYVGAVSGTSKPTGGWSTTIPTVPAGQYLWTRTTWQYTDGTSEQGYINALMGLTGASGRDGIAGKDGKGIKATAITYQASTNGTTAPTGTWSTSVPSVAKGSFLWTRTIWTYTDNTTETGYAVAYMGTNGNNGTNGIAGKDGTGIKTTTITYAVGTSGTTAPTGGWNSQVPNVPAGQYLWTKTVWAYTDNTSETGYSVSKFGEKGPKGDQGIQGIQGVDGRQGIPGPKGADGKTQYTHIAYANSADGVTDFSTSDSNRTYIGMYVNFNINDSTTPSDYSWTLVKGADGTQGTPGKPGADGKTPYFHTAWSYSADGTDGFTTVYPNLNLLEGTKDFSGDWWSRENWENDGTYKGLSVKRKVGSWGGITKQFIAPKDGVYTFSAYVKSSAGESSHVQLIVSLNDKRIKDEGIGSNFDWLRNSFQVTLKTGDRIYAQYNMTSSGTLWTAGHKWEEGSVATPHMPSASEAKTSDWPSYIGQYTDFTQADSTNPSDYTWSLIRGNDGKDGADGHDGRAGKDGVGITATTITYAISTSGTTAPNTGWTSSVPSLVKGQYLWTKTVWTYTDSSSETGYSVTYISKDGNNGTNGIAGKDGTGIKKTTITYAVGTSGTTAPASGWNSQVPNVPAGQYLWTKTVWAYTDNSSETGYSVAMMGNNGATGPAGSNGDPGKIVSDTEPTTRFKGLTWKYSGTTDLTASDGTVIKPNTEYYYNGTHWMINYLSANNIEANSITADLIDAKNLTITDGEFISKTTNGLVTTSTEIKDNHIAISKTDGTVNTRNDIALDSEQGLAQKFTNINTGFYRTAGINYQGPFTSDSDGNYAQLTPQGTKLSTDVPWTKLSLMNNFTGNIEYAIINGTVYISASGVGVPAMTAGQWKQAAQLPTGSSAIPIRANRIAAGDSGDGLSWALLSNQAGGIFIRCSANKAPTANLFNATLPYPIG
nr:hypothetical protein [Lactococcus lactis]